MTGAGRAEAGESSADATVGTGPGAEAAGGALRLFVAVVPPPLVLDDLAAVTASLRRRQPQLRWTRRDQWHVTLAFLGAVDRCRLARLAAGLRRAAAGADRPRLVLAGGGAFPDVVRARVLWRGLRGDLTPLAALTATVTGEAVAAGTPPDGLRRRFRPHLTVARCPAATDVTDLVAALDDRESDPWTVAEIRLVHSQLGRDHGGRDRTGQRVRYLTVGRWPLRTG